MRTLREQKNVERVCLEILPALLSDAQAWLGGPMRKLGMRTQCGNFAGVTHHQCASPSFACKRRVQQVMRRRAGRDDGWSTDEHTGGPPAATRSNFRYPRQSATLGHVTGATP
jgi:hypothetical protein